MVISPYDRLFYILNIFCFNRQLFLFDGLSVYHHYYQSILAVDTACAVLENVSVCLAKISQRVLCRKCCILKDSYSVLKVYLTVLISVAVE